jgi:dienelactone hydrolase
MKTSLKTAIYMIVLVGFCLCPSFGSAEEYEASNRREAFSNPTKRGSKKLKSSVWYPSKSGNKALAKAPAGGFPVVVFLHGLGALANYYPGLGRLLSQNGYIVVQSDTARYNPLQQRSDGFALFHALKKANKNAKSFWHGSLDMSRAAISGHSMGGGSSVSILARNPGYKAGFVFAPVDLFLLARRVKVPMGIVMGENDKFGWKTGEKLFKALPKKLSGTFFCLLSNQANHRNVIQGPYRNSGETYREVHTCTTKLCLAFFNKHLKGDGEALDKFWATADKQPHLKKVLR